MRKESIKNFLVYISRSTLAIVLSFGLFGFVLVPLKSEAALNKRIYLTTGTTWTVPSDWNSSSNSIEAIGGGANGATGARFVPGVGGGGGAYAKISNLALTGGASVTYQVAAIATDTVFNSSATTCAGSPTPSVCAKGSGGTAAASIGTVKYSGGTTVDSGGGGAAGPGGAGSAGGFNDGGAGGPGGGGAGGLGANAQTFPGDNGQSGTEFDSIPGHGSGGGGGGGGGANTDTFEQGGSGGDGGYYGGGGGGGGDGGGDFSTFMRGAGGAGGPGIIIITYTSTEEPSASYAQFKILGWSVRIRGGKIIIK